MKSAKERTTSASLEQHLRNMGKQLEKGEGHILIGAVFDQKGFSPVTFVCNVRDDFREAVEAVTPATIVKLLKECAESLSKGTTH
jgi:hypothetical protein